jgi:hypothetical protein
MTPNGIEILIHCYVSGTPHPRREAPAVKEQLENFEREGLITQLPGIDTGYMTTDKGKAHVLQLCNTPLPRKIWIDATGKPIEEVYE